MHSTSPLSSNVSSVGMACAGESHSLLMKQLRRRGLLLLLAGLGGVLLWSATMPVDEALAGSGVLGAASQRKAVQPAFGGVLGSLSVHEGERVKAGQVLMKLDVGAQTTELAAARRQLLLAQVSHLRLSALLAGAAQLDVPSSLQGEAQAMGAQDILSEQAGLFASQLRTRQAEQLQYAAQAAQLQIEQAKQTSQAAQQRQLRELAQGQVASLSELVSQGFYSRVRLADTERQLGEARMNESRLQADAHRSRELLASVQAERASQSARQRAAWEAERLELERVQSQWRARIAVLTATLAQAEVVAPVTGTVVGLTVHAPGAVVQTAQTLMEIVPADDALMVEARFPLSSGEKLVAGMDADLRMVSLDRATTPVIRGKVQTVSADRMEDVRSGQPYLRVQIAIVASERARLQREGITLRPGLPAEAHVRLGERTLLGHMIKPLSDRLALAFKA